MRVKRKSRTRKADEDRRIELFARLIEKEKDLDKYRAMLDTFNWVLMDKTETVQSIEQAPQSPQNECRAGGTPEMAAE